MNTNDDTEFERGRLAGIKEIWEKLPHGILEDGLMLGVAYQNPKTKKQKEFNTKLWDAYVLRSIDTCRKVNDILFEYKDLVKPLGGLGVIVDEH